MELAQRYHLKETLIRGLSSLADLYVALEEWDAAASTLAEALTHVEELGTPCELSEIYRSKALVALAQQRLRAALEAAKLATQYGKQMSPDEEGMSLRVLGEVLATIGRHDQAYLALRRSLALLAEGNPYETARTRRELARTMLALDRPVSVADTPPLTLLQQAQTCFERLGAQHDMMIVAELLKQL
jgi:tetratricopeptide (TPR) repeat protein